MQPLASGSHFSAASIIFSSCRSPKQLPPKPTKAILAANVCELVEGQRGETSKRASSSRRASSIWCIFPRSANHSSHGPCRVRLSFRSGKATGPGLLIGSTFRSHAGAISWLTIISNALLWTPEASYFGAYRIANRGCENLIGPLIYKVFA